MKKAILSLLLALCLCPCTALAESFATAGDLFQHWMVQSADPDVSAYPPYICGVWSTDGGMENLTFAVTDDEAGEAGREEILQMVERDETVQFAVQKYSHAELMAIKQAIVPHLNFEDGIFGVGIDEMGNAVHVDGDTENPAARAFMAECAALYGDRVAFTHSGGAFVTAEELSPREAHPEVYLLVIPAVLLCAGLWAVLRRQVLLMTNLGAAAAEEKKVEAALRGWTEQPGAEADRALLEKVRGEERKQENGSRRAE